MPRPPSADPSAAARHPLRLAAPAVPIPWPKLTRVAVAYYRVSTEEQARDGVGLKVQRERVRAYAVAAGIELDDACEFVEEGASGKSLNRPQLQRVLSMIRAGRVRTLIVFKLDRLTRSPRDIWTLVEDELHPHGVELVSVSEAIDARTPQGRAMLGLLSIFAQMERETLVERTRSALHLKRDRGDRLGTPPLGFRAPVGDGAELRPLVPIPGELSTARRVLALAVTGATWETVAETLNREGHRTKRGKRWQDRTASRVWTARDLYRVPFGSERAASTWFGHDPHTLKRVTAAEEAGDLAGELARLEREGTPAPKCEGCGVLVGSRHADGCRAEECPACGGVLVECRHLSTKRPTRQDRARERRRVRVGR